MSDPRSISAPVSTDIRSTAYAIAARSQTDYRPIEGWLRGERGLPRGVRGERIAAAARELGVEPRQKAA